jgi:hypothetical protein
VVSNPGVYMVSVAYTVTEKNLILDGYPRYIVPLRVINSKNLTELIKIVPDETVSIPFDGVKSYFLSGALWVRDVDPEELPVKGERVLATFDNKDSSLLCTNIELLPREELDYINIDNLLEFRKTLFNLMKTNT